MEDDLADGSDEPAVEVPDAPTPPPLTDANAESDSAPERTTPRPPDVVLDVDFARLISSSVRDIVTP